MKFLIDFVEVLYFIFIFCVKFGLILICCVFVGMEVESFIEIEFENYMEVSYCCNFVRDIFILF